LSCEIGLIVSVFVKKFWIAPFLVLGASVLPALEKAFEFQPALLKAIDCQVQVPVGWSVYDQSRPGSPSWVITPDDLGKADYKTGVKIALFEQVESRTGNKASKWVAARVNDKSASLPVISSETGSTNDYFQVRRLVTEEVYSPGRMEYTTNRKLYSWYWNDKQDVVICLEARTPEKSWTAMSAVLEGMGKLEFDVSAWKKKLKISEE
jgi:hypothetical protein